MPKPKGTTKTKGENEKIKLYSQFFGGIVRDDKSSVVGGALNVEELDILENANYVKPTFIFSADTLPATTEAYSYCEDNNGNGYAYGKETAANKVRILKSTTIGGTPGAWSSFFTSADGAHPANVLSPIEYHRVTESGTANDYLYYVAGTNQLTRYGPLNGSPTEQVVGTLSQLVSVTNGRDRISFRRFYGQLWIPIGKYVSKVDDTAVFSESAFTLPSGVYAVDIAPASDVAVVLCRYLDSTNNASIAYWWDLVQPTTFADHFDIPMGGPQWIYNFKQTMALCCAINGTMKLFRLSSPNPGAVLLAFPNIQLNNVAIETDAQPISPAYSVFTKDDILYFSLWKTDKSGLYGFGTLDSKYPFALWLAKRFNTTDYSLHKPFGARAFGKNFFAAYIDNATNTAVQCKPATASRSSNAIFRAVWDDDGQPFNKKDLTKAYITSYPLPASTSLALTIYSDYATSSSDVKRADTTVFNTLNGVIGFFKPTSFLNKLVYSWQVNFTSSGANCPTLTAVGLRLVNKSLE